MDLKYPFTGRWPTWNGPANRVPSHGTTLFATTHAIDFVPISGFGGTAPITLASLVRPEPPESFPGFGRALLAPVEGVVVATHDTQPDHAAYRTLPPVGCALTRQRRAATGWVALAGNHVLVETGTGAVVALCHLRHGSLVVRPGQHVCVVVPLTFRGTLPHNGEIIDASR